MKVGYISAGKNPADWIARLKAAGFTHLVVKGNWSGYAKWLKPCEDAGIVPVAGLNFHPANIEWMRKAVFPDGHVSDMACPSDRANLYGLHLACDWFRRDGFKAILLDGECYRDDWDAIPSQYRWLTTCACDYCKGMPGANQPVLFDAGIAEVIGDLDLWIYPGPRDVWPLWAGLGNRAKIWLASETQSVPDVARIPAAWVAEPKYMAGIAVAHCTPEQMAEFLKARPDNWWVHKLDDFDLPRKTYWEAVKP